MDETVPDEEAIQEMRRRYRLLFNSVRNGFLAETLVFAHLKDSPVLRAIEFSPVDGALYIPWRGTSSLPKLWSERLQATQSISSLPTCLNFDLKNRSLVERR